MTFQKSSSNNHMFAKMYWHTIRRNLGMTGIYALLLALIYPLRTLYFVFFNRSTIIMDTSFALVTLAVPIAFCVFIALRIFRYLHSKTATDFYHSLPIGRVPMLAARYLAGLTMTLVPFLVLRISQIPLVGILIRSNGEDDLIKTALNNTMSWSLVSLLPIVCSLLALYSLTVFIAMNAGTTMDAVVTLLALNIGWGLLISSLQSLINGLLYGFPGFSDTAMYFLSLVFSPLMALPLSSTYSSYTAFYFWGTIGVLLATAALAFAGSLLLYRKRKSEYAGQVFSYPYVKALIKAVIALAVGISLAMGLSGQQNDTASAVRAFLIGFLIASFVTYLVAHVIFSRGFKAFGRSLILYGSTAACFVLVYFAVGFDIFGYQTRVPELSKIESIEAVDGSATWKSQFILTEYDDEESKKAFLALHQSIVEEIKKDTDSAFLLNRSHWPIGEDPDQPYDDWDKPYQESVIQEPIVIQEPTFPDEKVQTEENPQKRSDNASRTKDSEFENPFTLTYHFKNGTKMTREFSINPVLFRSKLDDIYDLKEYQNNHNLLFGLDTSKHITATFHDDYSNFSYSADRELTKKLLEAMRKDYEAAAKEDLDKNPVGALILKFHEEDELDDVARNPKEYFYSYEQKKYTDYYDVPYWQMGALGVFTLNCYFVYPSFENTIQLLESETGRNLRQFPEGTKALLCNYLTEGLWDEHGYAYNLADDYETLNCCIVDDPKQLAQLRDATVNFNYGVMDSGFFLQYYYPDGTHSRLFYCWGPDVPEFFHGLGFGTLEPDEIQALGAGQ